MTMYRYVVILLAAFVSTSWSFDLVRDHSGEHFFDGWDFYGYWDNLTLGDVWWLDASDAMSQRLAYVNDAGQAVIKVDNTSNVALNEKRNTVRITSSDLYDYGSLWVADLTHLPYGCSVWPAFWAKGPLWPDDGEIDIIEAINLMDHNQMALHTTQGCLHEAPPDQKGRNINLDCGTGSGCTVAETAPNSYGPGFAAAGGGVWATQFDVAGIYMWFWSRPDVPQNLRQLTSPSSSLDISQWGPPSASFPVTTTCNLTQFFTSQQLVFDITLCGDWAGVPGIYGPTCGNSGPTGKCYEDNVVGAGSPKYDNAYFEVNYVRAYTTGTPAPTAAPGSTTPPSSGSPPGTAPPGTAEVTTTAVSAPTQTPGVAPVNQNNTSSASADRQLFYGILLAFGTGFVAMLCTIF